MPCNYSDNIFSHINWPLEQPLKALEAYQLSFGLARRLDDTKRCASSLCHSARLLLDLGAPELAEVIQFPYLLRRLNWDTIIFSCLFFEGK